MMNSNMGMRFLRPYLCKEVNVASRTAYSSFFSTVSSRQLAANKKSPSKKSPAAAIKALSNRHDIEQRAGELTGTSALEYPRIQRTSRAITCKEYRETYGDLVPGEKRQSLGHTLRDSSTIYRENFADYCSGRVLAFRVSGKGLFFVDIVQDGYTVQIVCQIGDLNTLGEEVSSKQFSEFYHLIRRGDILTATGYVYTSQRGEISLRATELPIILSPSLASLPTTLEDRETRVRNRHVDLLVNRSTADTLRARSHIVKFMRDFFHKDNFLEVQTPIIADKAGGAIARPFTTVATEFSDKPLALRIAPEIWLKRMVLGGIDRVFEIGPAFRNEGLDATHNPEFTTCEFYKAYAELEELIEMTEQLISGLATHISELRHSKSLSVPEMDSSLSITPYKRIAFIPAIEAALGEPLPSLTADDAEEKLLALYTTHNLTPPSSPTLPRLLDKLAAIYIEPSCASPTFITHHPACMAPLSKSFLCPLTSQLVSARAELFIQHREIANMYEEENSPFEQRRKFVQQLRWRDDENRTGVDESYLQALEYGLPPTGGWGAGVDRLCMMLTGANRIGDVLSFGSLRNVVHLGKEGGDA